MVILGEFLRQFLVPQHPPAGPHHLLQQGGGRQHPLGPHGHGEGGGGHSHSVTVLFHLAVGQLSPGPHGHREEGGGLLHSVGLLHLSHQGAFHLSWP